MAENVDVVLLTTTVEGAAGDRVTVTAARGKLLERGGAARPATVPDAGKIGAAKDSADTQKTTAKK